uniref:Uncharacterized protein n=1 Tax=Acrobeloides nanus TaxID=290746 RepID=A0A914EPF0_9BILA
MQLRSHMFPKFISRASSSKVVPVTSRLNVSATSDSDLATPIHIKLEERFSKNNIVSPYHRQPNLIKANRIERRFKDDEKILRREFLAENDLTGDNARLFDYYKISKYVQQLDKTTDRIDFVNPFERDWTRFEQRWHRPFHQKLLRPRKAWCLPAIPAYFDTLDFYKYLTKMRVIVDDALFDGYYEDKSLKNFPLERFEKNLSELLISYGIAKPNLTEEQVSWFLKAIIDVAQISFPSRISQFNKYRISFSERCESFWIRAGFRHMYNRRKIWMSNPYTVARHRFPGDDRRKLGELTFVMRDKHAVQIRTYNEPLKPIFPWNDQENLFSPIFDDHSEISEILYNPLVYNLRLDGDHLWQCPGFDQDSAEPYRHGRLAIKNIFALKEKLAYWGIDEDVDPDEYEETLNASLQSIATTSLFSWLNAQAHCLGYTQYTDLDKEPLTSQLMLSDGIHYFFALGQLNTIAINVDVHGFDNDRTNACLVTGPLRLFEEFDESTKTFFHKDSSGKNVEGLNKDVLLRIIQMLL